MFVLLVCRSYRYDLFVVLLMMRRPPRSTRTDSLFPFTTLFLSIRIALMFFLCSHMGMNRLDKNAIADALLAAPGWAKLGLTEPREHLRSEEHTSELLSLMRLSYAVFCLKKKIKQQMNKTQVYIVSCPTQYTIYTQ